MTDLADIIDSDLLPPLLQDFERLIGLPATFDLVRVYGGLRIYIPTPARVHPDHAIAKIIGVDRLMALAKVYGANEHFTLPKAEKAILARQPPISAVLAPWAAHFVPNLPSLPGKVKTLANPRRYWGS